MEYGSIVAKLIKVKYDYSSEINIDLIEEGGKEDIREEALVNVASALFLFLFRTYGIELSRIKSKPECKQAILRQLMTSNHHFASLK